MKVIVPYAPGKLHPITKAILQSYGVNPQFECVRGRYGYSRLLKRLWSEGETVVIVEHDVAPWPGAVEELHNCIAYWCSCSYRHGGAHGLYHMLGCTKLGSELMRLLPGLWDNPVPWDRCDAHLLFAARDAELDPHPHRPPVIHLSPTELQL